MQESGEQSSSEAALNEQSPSLGTRLKRAREKKELALEKIADELRIDAHVLRSLEDDRLGDIGVAPVFVKGYIKQYGRQLGLDYDELRKVYVAQIESEEIDLLPSRSIRLRDERQITIWIISALVLLLVGVFLFVWWLNEESAPLSSIRTPSSGAGRDAVGNAPSLVAPVPAPAPGVAVRDQDAGAVAESPRDARELPDTAPVAVPEQPLGQTSVPATQSPDGIAPTPNTGARPSPAAVARPVLGNVVPEPGALTIAVRFREDSWAELTTGDGRRVFYDLGVAGSDIVFAGQPPISVLLGNADGVDISVDDVPFAVPRQGRRGNVANFVIAAPSD